jgi:Beta-lactamase
MKLRCAFALAVLLCVVSQIRAAEGPAPPDTPQGRRIKALLTAFDTGTFEATRAFVTENFAPDALKEVPIEQRVERLSGMARETGPLTFQKILPGERGEVSFLARSKKNGDWLEIGLMLDVAPPHGLRGLRFEQVDGPEVARESRKRSDAEASAAADAHLQKLASAGEFSGVVLMAKNGTPFFHKAYGLADRSFAVPNRPDTKFNLGSINKIFTQTAIAQLAEQGKLSLSDTIRKHLPDYPSAVADRITIQQLVTMSSGLGDFFGEKFDATPKIALRARHEPALFQRGLRRTRPHRREDLRRELLRLRARVHLRAGRDDGFGLVSPGRRRP